MFVQAHKRDRDDVVRGMLFAVTELAWMPALPAAAEMFGRGFQPSGDKSSTLAAAYKALQARIDAPQHQPLLAAQRLWLQYRDANCGFYGVQDGSIQQVQAAECIRSMTAARARELEKAMEFDKGDNAPILSLPDVEARAKLRDRSDLRAGPMSITIERVVEASPELHDLIGELNDILGAAYKTINVTAFRSTNCSSLMCAYSWRGLTASWRAAFRRPPQMFFVRGEG
jgi:hypothetical protein